MSSSLSSDAAPPSALPRSPGHTFALLVGGLGGPLFIICFLTLGLVAAGYTTARDTISGLEFTHYGWLQQANFIVYGVIQVCFAIGLRLELQRGRGAILIPLFQLLTAVAVIGDGVFIHEPLHMACDLVAFNSTLLVLFLFAWRLWGNPQWKRWSAYSIATAVVMMACLTAFGLSDKHVGMGGMFEKLAVITRTTWTVIFVARLLSGHRLADCQGGPAPEAAAG